MQIATNENGKSSKKTDYDLVAKGAEQAKRNIIKNYFTIGVLGYFILFFNLLIFYYYF